MLILVAVTVRTVIQSGLFSHAGKATSGYSMHEAREQLGTTLAGAMAEKYTNKDYNETDYLNQYIKDNLPNTKIEGNIAIVDGWAFELDRSVPKIEQDLGKEGTFTYPDLKLEKGILAENQLSIPIKIIAKEAENGISKIEVILNGKVVQTFEDCNNSTEELTRIYTATENGNYSVKVYSKVNRTGYITVDEIIPSTPQIGDYVRYTPDSAENYLIEERYIGYSDQSIPQDTGLKWQIMNMNSDGTIDLVADRPISSTVYFQGALGYNNGVYLLNDLCKSQYSNATLGVVGRSINLFDIEKHFNDEGKSARDIYIYTSGSKEYKYGGTASYPINHSWTPDIYKKYDKNVTKNPTNNIAQLESENGYSNPTTATSTDESSLTVTQTMYDIASQAIYYDESDFHTFIFDNDTAYWLASRCVCCDSSEAKFGLRTVNGTNFSYKKLFTSFGQNPNSYCAVRPVVEISSEYKLQQVLGTSEWEIVEK